MKQSWCLDMLKHMVNMFWSTASPIEQTKQDDLSGNISGLYSTGVRFEPGLEYQLFSRVLYCFPEPFQGNFMKVP
jgi:hypothetical protein